MLLVDLEQAARWREFRHEIRTDRTKIPTLIAAVANASRRRALEMVSAAGLGHLGGDFSVIDILTTLYGAVLNVDPTQPDWPERDRLILSKGHCSEALYATLTWAGFFSADELVTFDQPDSPLNGHPNRNEVPGVETNTGALGHGLPVAVGCAIGARLQQLPSRVFVVLGDGELQEGSNWEAAMTASHYKLGNLTAIVDRNRLQQGARTESTVALDPLDQKWRSFGWNVREIYGHDYDELFDALTITSDQPICVIANTVKGKGVSFMEDRAEWHHKIPTPEQLVAALAELSA